MSRSYAEATAFLSGETAVFVGTLVRLRLQYAKASIVQLSLVRPDAPLAVWLGSRESWTEIKPLPPAPGPVAGHAATTDGPARPG